MRKAAEAVGEPVEAIPSPAVHPSAGAEERFLGLLDEIVGEQLHGTAKSRLSSPAHRAAVMRHDPDPVGLLWRDGRMVASAIEPDNLPNMSLETDTDRICLQFSTEKIGTCSPRLTIY